LRAAILCGQLENNTLRAQQAGAACGGAAAATAPAAGSSANEASFGPAVDQGHKSLAEMRQERQVHPNMQSVFRRTYSSPSTVPNFALRENCGGKRKKYWWYKNSVSVSDFLIIFNSDTHRQITAGFNMSREAGITSFTK